jgi:hypothetical protein
MVAANVAARASVAGSDDVSSGPDVYFEDAVASIVKSRCVSCHNARKHEGGVDLSTPAGIVAGGDAGVIVDRDRPGESVLLERVVSGEMPPEGEPPLSANQILRFRRWIESGAKFRKPPRQKEISQHDVIPILLLRCTACHGTRRREGGLDLRTRESILKGGASGPAVVPGNPDESLLLQRIHKEEMPPRRKLVSVSVKPMTASELKTVEVWIQNELPIAKHALADEANQRAKVTDEERGFWSFQPPRAVEVPSTAVTSSNPIDAFVASKLAERGLELVPKPERRTLMRRACFALHGLPPDPDSVDTFVADSSADSFKRLVDQFLASPRYGERWARHWLDAAGYADSEGAQNEDRIRPHIWRYRDYVIRAFNVDKPYDQFLMEQIAGDELADYSDEDAITPEVYDNLVATGFLRTTPDRTFANITNFVPDRLEVIADEIQVFSSAVLGLTLQCARCHDHKFDPLSQRDYYSLTAIFKDAYDEHDWLKSQGPRTLPHVTTAERTAWKNEVQTIDKKIAALQKQVDTESDADKQAAFKKQIAELNSQKPPEPRIRALWSRGEPSPAYLLRRGNYLTPGELVAPNIPDALAPAGFTYEPLPPKSKQSGTGRRSALARWLTRPDHPLTSRVIVSRIWKHHFGRGIVATVDNFGATGERPSHPELLDWLATEFVRNGWSIKWLHRQILTSATWQQSSLIHHTDGSEDSAVSDDDRISLLYGAPMRRMEAEVVRDSLLSLSGQLDLTPFGKPDSVTERPDGLVTSVRSKAGWRRSIYVLQRRTKIPTLLENFDSPQMGPNCLQRSESIVAPQALHLLNNGMVHELAGHFADRVVRRVGSDSQKQITEIWRLALSRHPTSEELRESQDSLTRLANHWRQVEGETDESAARKSLASFCHAIMNSAAFLYID